MIVNNRNYILISKTVVLFNLKKTKKNRLNEMQKCQLTKKAK